MGGEKLEMLFKENPMYLKCQYAVLSINSLSLKKEINLTPINTSPL